MLKKSLVFLFHFVDIRSQFSAYFTPASSSGARCHAKILNYVFRQSLLWPEKFPVAIEHKQRQTSSYGNAAAARSFNETPKSNRDDKKILTAASIETTAICLLNLLSGYSGNPTLGLELFPLWQRQLCFHYFQIEVLLTSFPTQLCILTIAKPNNHHRSQSPNSKFNREISSRQYSRA